VSVDFFWSSAKRRLLHYNRDWIEECIFSCLCRSRFSFCTSGAATNDAWHVPTRLSCCLCQPDRYELEAKETVLCVCGTVIVWYMNELLMQYTAGNMKEKVDVFREPSGNDGSQDMTRR
jgi:hypothetical protein